MADTLNIGSAGGAAGAGILTDLLQKYVDFATGPWAAAVIAGGLILGIGIWVFMPKEGPMGWIVRALVGGTVLMNLGLFLTDIGFN
jgi:hypothetical protein